MKKIIFILTLLSLVACSDDDNNSVQQPYTGSLAGTWKTVLSTYNGYENVDTSDCGNVNQNVEGTYWTYIFNSDNTYTIPHTCNADVLIGSGTYTFSNGILSTSDSGSDLNYDVTIVSDNRIRIETFSGSDSDYLEYSAVLEKQ